MTMKKDIREDVLFFVRYCIKNCTKKAADCSAALLSEWPDSNGRPLAPHARMLANCTTPRLFNCVEISDSTQVNLAICGCKDTNVFRIVVQLIEKKLPLQSIISKL